MFLYEKQFSLNLHVDFVVQLDEIFLVKNFTRFFHPNSTVTTVK